MSAADGGDDTEVDSFAPVLYRMSDGKSFSRVAKVGGCCMGSKVNAKQKFSDALLKQDGAFLLDTGFHIYLWVGKDAPKDARSQVRAIFSCQAYLQDNNL